MLPGMERKLTEHMMVHHYTATASEASGRSLQEVPLLKGSFGHHSSSIGGVASSSQESLYGGGVGVGGHPHLPSGSSVAGPMLSSDSLHSLRGHHLRYCTIYCNDNVTTNEKSIYIKQQLWNWMFSQQKYRRRREVEHSSEIKRFMLDKMF